jgi:hypothetical protein
MLGLCATVVNCGWNRFKLAEFRGGLFNERPTTPNRSLTCCVTPFEK